jgi:hypothetical protein
MFDDVWWAQDVFRRRRTTRAVDMRVVQRASRYMCDLLISLKGDSAALGAPRGLTDRCCIEVASWALGFDSGVATIE